ncbi:hypothetical protein [Actinomadura formosensis]|uniref:hypothetical protein n=1 Tax=Actinomadura formosensis TaxID=60706 RepID=UPI003D945E04
MGRAIGSPRATMASILLGVSLLSGLAAALKEGSGGPAPSASPATEPKKPEKSDEKPDVAAAGVVWQRVVPGGGPGIDGRPGQGWFDAMNSRDCAALPGLGGEGVRAVYRGLGQACLAVTQGAVQSWGPAARELANVEQAPASCTDGFAYRLLRDLVIAHLLRPDRPPVITGEKTVHMC